MKDCSFYTKGISHPYLYEKLMLWGIHEIGSSLQKIKLYQNTTEVLLCICQPRQLERKHGDNIPQAESTNRAFD